MATAWKHTCSHGPAKSAWLALGVMVASAAVEARHCSAAVDACGVLIDAEPGLWDRLREQVLVKAWAGLRE